ncbi:MAG: phosphopyruvate hydratase [Alphaproteobacteria bacterium]|nr:phosphopyruvate hydratase [Rickettsiales bacterium]
MLVCHILFYFIVSSRNFIIKNIAGYQVYDSRGRPTVEACVVLESGVTATAIAPSGASVGSMEAVELRDKSRTGLGSVATAVKNISTKINKHLSGMDVRFQTEIDEALILLDGTNNKSILGGNAILATSLAVARVASISSEKSLYNYLGGLNATVLPVPMMNFINGGVHADNSLDIQEFMIMPVRATSFSDAILMASEILYVLRDLLKTKNLSTSVGDEGGFAIDINVAESALDLLMVAIDKAGYTAGEDILLSIDVAASELYKGGLYNFKGEGEQMNHQRLVSYYRSLLRNYPIFSIEDPCSEHDISGFQLITKTFGEQVQIVGDDVFATNADLLQEGILKGVCNALIIKPNQIGTITETLDTIRVAKTHGYQTIASHRSGETEDSTIAHLAVGFGCYQIKAGSLARTDRVVKYNELLRIEREIGRMSMYAGQEVLRQYRKFRKNITDRN